MDGPLPVHTITLINIGKDERDQPFYISLFLLPLRLFQIEVHEGAKENTFPFTQEDVQPILWTLILLFPYTIKTFKSGEGKMSGPLMYLVAFRSVKWPDGRRPTNTHLIKIYLCISQTDTISRENIKYY